MDCACENGRLEERRKWIAAAGEYLARTDPYITDEVEPTVKKLKETYDGVKHQQRVLINKNIRRGEAIVAARNALNALIEEVK